MPWEPLAEWGPLDSDFDELSPPSNSKEGDVSHKISTVFKIFRYNYCHYHAFSHVCSPPPKVEKSAEVFHKQNMMILSVPEFFYTAGIESATLY